MHYTLINILYENPFGMEYILLAGRRQKQVCKNDMYLRKEAILEPSQVDSILVIIYKIPVGLLQCGLVFE